MIEQRSCKPKVVGLTPPPSTKFIADDALGRS